MKIGKINIRNNITNKVHQFPHKQLVKIIEEVKAQEEKGQHIIKLQLK